MYVEAKTSMKNGFLLFSVIKKLDFICIIMFKYNLNKKSLKPLNISEKELFL